MDFTLNKVTKNTCITKYQQLSVLLILGIVILFDDIGDSAINLAIPPITTALHGDINIMQWILNGYLITAAAFLVFAGRLGDVIGPKKIFILGLSFFTVSSALAGFASSATFLIIARVFQGLSFSLTYPMIIVLARAAFPSNQQGKLMGLMSAFAGIALAIGPPLAGFLIHTFGWRSIFLMNLPLGLTALTLAIYTLNENKVDIPQYSLDYLGLGFLVFSLLSIMTCIIEFNQWHTSSYLFKLLFATGIISLLIFIFHERRIKNPLLDFTIFNNTNYAIGNIIRFLIQSILFNIFFVFSLFFQNICNYTPLEAGSIFLAMTSSMVIFSYYAGKLTDKIGFHIILRISLMLLIITCILFSNIHYISNFIYIISIFIFAGFAISFFLPSINAATLNNISTNKSGVATGFYFMIVTLSGGIGVIISSYILSTKSNYFLTKLLLNSHIMLNDKQKTLIFSIASATSSIKEIKTSFTPALQSLFLDFVNKSFLSAYSTLIWSWILFACLAFIASFFIKNTVPHINS